jgi:Tol biopolymer transport system component
MLPRFLRAALVAAVLALVSPALAHATVAYVKGINKPAVYVANDDGSGARRLAVGDNPHVSPDGQTIVYVTGIAQGTARLRAQPAAGGPVRTLLSNWSFGVFDWSDDGRWIITMGGRLNGKQKLVLIDMTTGTSRTIARGFFSGGSFSPASDQVVYAEIHSDRQLFSKSNLYTAPVAGGPSHGLTHHGHALDPVWGPTDVAYSHWARPTGKHRHEDGPKYNIWLIKPDGSGDHALTHDHVPFLLSGLSPVDWSADGTKLLTQFGGQDTAYAVTVDPATGHERVVGKKSQSIVGTRLSKDGSTILAFTGGAGEDPRLENVIAVPYGGGAATRLAKGAAFPDWNR